MSEIITQINPAPGVDTFQIWVDQTNKAINAISTVVVSVNTHANGGLTTGNGFVEGTFGARNLRANTISGGTVQTPGILTISSNVNLTGATITVGDVVINSTAIAVDGVELETGGGTLDPINTTGTTAQVVDFFDKLIYRSAEYLLNTTDNNANAFQATKMVVIHNSGDAHWTEYAVVFSNTQIADYSANANSTHVRLYLTPNSTNTTVTGLRTLVAI